MALLWNCYSIGGNYFGDFVNLIYRVNLLSYINIGMILDPVIEKRAYFLIFKCWHT